MAAFIIVAALPAAAQQDSTAGYYLQSEKQIERKEAGTHNGGGETVAYRFFEKTPGSTLQLTRRILEKGAAIGYHLQKEEEIYYVLSGNGEMNVNGKIFPVKSGDAVLTLPGNSHGIRQTGAEPLVLIINYKKKG
ncbi:MAG: cupin domain-containing protein [Ferruginibacter sp.]